MRLMNRFSVRVCAFPSCHSFCANHIAYNHITCLQASKDFIDVFLQMFNSSKHPQSWHIESHCVLLIERLLIDKKSVLSTEQVLSVVVYQKGQGTPCQKQILISLFHYEALALKKTDQILVLGEELFRF